MVKEAKKKATYMRVHFHVCALVVLLLYTIGVDSMHAQDHVASWSGNIWGLPNGMLPAGPVLGNGDFGMTLQTGNDTGCLELWLGLNSMWGVPSTVENPINNMHGSGNTYNPTATYPHQMSLGGVTICAPLFKRANFSALRRANQSADGGCGGTCEPRRLLKL